MAQNNVSSSIGEFITNNLRTIVMCGAFLIGMYLQHQANTMRIEALENELVKVNVQLDAQYARLDNMKLDKAVFEATMKQFTDMSQDIRQIRERMEDMMGKYGHQTNRN